LSQFRVAATLDLMQLAYSAPALAAGVYVYVASVAIATFAALAVARVRTGKRQARGFIVGSTVLSSPILLCETVLCALVLPAAAGLVLLAGAVSTVACCLPTHARRSAALVAACLFALLTAGAAGLFVEVSGAELIAAGLIAVHTFCAACFAAYALERAAPIRLTPDL
jgi:hypothetical protein